MILSARTSAAPLLAALLLAMDAGGARAQGPIVRLPEQDRALTGTAPQVFAIGRAEGADHEMFGIVASVKFDAADNLYVLDRQNPRVLVYDRNGRFVRQIGRRGQGPGELIVPLALVITDDGTVVIQDLGRPAYSLFRPDGTFIRNVPMDEWMPGFSAALAWHPRGGVVGAFRQGGPVQRGSRTETEGTVPLMFQPLAGGTPTRLFNVPQQWTIEQSAQPAGGGERVQMRITGPPMFAPSLLVDVLPDGQIALSFTSGYTVRILDANGQTLRYLQRPMRTRLTTDADRERAREARRELISSGRGAITITRGGGGGAPAGPPPPDLRQRMERDLVDMRFADTIPALRGLRVAPSGKLWVERTGPIVGEDGPVDLVTAEGQYLGTISEMGLPDAFSRGGLAAYIEEDDDGVQKVVVRRLPPNWR